jgi:DNA-binding CsgD family transcriptional regulator
MSGLELLSKLHEWRIEKPFRRQVLLDSIQEALHLDARMRRRRRDRQDIQSRLRLLTPREREVLNHLITGKTNKNTAYELGISPKTVDFHRVNTLEKIGVGSLVELVHLVQGGAATWNEGREAPPQDDPAPVLLPSRQGGQGRSSRGRDPGPHGGVWSEYGGDPCGFCRASVPARHPCCASSHDICDNRQSSK